MSDVITFNTQDNSVVKNQYQVDPWDHLDVDGWVQKQVEWGENNISGQGLIPYFKELGDQLVGAEIGVCLGMTTELIAKNVDIKKMYAIDHYPTYIDWNGLPITQERQDRIKAHAHARLVKYSPKIAFVYESSAKFCTYIGDEFLDFIFIDGDHSYEGALQDFKRFYPKVKSGGIFAGHDLNIPTVNKALREFLGDKFNSLIAVENNAWLIYKD
jgi:hypothetical protein